MRQGQVGQSEDLERAGTSEFQDGKQQAQQWEQTKPETLGD